MMNVSERIGVWLATVGFFLFAISALGQEAASRPALPPPATRPESPEVLPGKGLAQHPFLYAGEWDTRKKFQTMFLVRDGKVVWSYSMPNKDENGNVTEFDDATQLSNGNIVFTRKVGASEITPDKKVIWNYIAPKGCEVHSIQPIDANRVLIMQNGNPAKLMIINTTSGTTEKEMILPTKNSGVHGQFRHIRMTAAGTFLVSHMDMGKVIEYDADGKEIWSVAAPSCWAAVRLKNGNTLISGNQRCYAREVNPKGEIVWELTPKDLPEYKIFNIQECDRLANGNTVVANWVAGDKNHSHWPDSVQILEVNPEKKVVWALRSWTDPADLGPSSSIQLLDEPGIPEKPGDLQH
ncbi:MAG: arylsulfotransferase family protein [Planctomycetota bacterium]|nr:arylsulfotransferase family protein [Planctomycetota bacterium]